MKKLRIIPLLFVLVLVLNIGTANLTAFASEQNPDNPPVSEIENVPWVKPIKTVEEGERDNDPGDIPASVLEERTKAHLYGQEPDQRMAFWMPNEYPWAYRNIQSAFTGYILENFATQTDETHAQICLWAKSTPVYTPGELIIRVYLGDSILFIPHTQNLWGWFCYHVPALQFAQHYYNNGHNYVKVQYWCDDQNCNVEVDDVMVIVEVGSFIHRFLPFIMKNIHW